MNKKLLKIFLYWMTERHNVFLKKEAGDPWPWTKDLILQEYKFTNPFRQNDKVTRDLTMCLSGTKSHPINAFTRIIIFRMFNWPLTYQSLKDVGLVDKWDTKKAIKVLSKRSDEGEQVFTGAYIITNNGKTESKISLVCKAVGAILKNRESVVKQIQSNKSLEYAVDYLCTYSMVGPFIGYELVTDMRHTKILNRATDIFTWANPGPGAKRGIHRLLFNTERGELPKGEKIDYQKMMQELIPPATEAFDPVVGFPFTATIEMRDIEHSLCEFDKYMRVKNGEGRPRSKYRRTK